PRTAPNRRIVCTRVTPGEPSLWIGGSARVRSGERPGVGDRRSRAGSAVAAEVCEGDPRNALSVRIVKIGHPRSLDSPLQGASFLTDGSPRRCGAIGIKQDGWTGLP